MIEYDFVLERDEGDETRVYKPDKIPKKLPDLVYVEGPNSSGKSTLLHILALSLHGLKKEKINPALHSKMKALMNPQHQKLQFEVKITNKDKSVQILSKKENPESQEIVVYEIKNGKRTILTPEALERKYNLIYDIPDNPTERLNQLTYEIKDIQQTYGNRVGALRSYIHNVITDIRNSRDPDRLETLRKQVDKLREEYARLEGENNLTEKDLEVLEKYTYSKHFDYYMNEYVNSDGKIKRLEKEKKKKVRQTKKRSKEFEYLKSSIKVAMKTMKEHFYEATSLLGILIPAEEKHLVDIWERIDLNDALYNLEFNDDLKRYIITFKVILIKIIDDEKKQKSLIEARMYQEFIEFLEQYRLTKIIVPGIKKTIPEFINILKHENKKNEELLTFSRNVDKTLELLDQLNENREIIEENYFSRLRNLGEDEIEGSYGFSDYDEIEAEISDLEKEIKKIEGKCDFYRTECAKKAINENKLNDILFEMEKIEELSPYFKYTEEQLITKISELRETLLDYKKEMEIKKHYIRMYKSDIDKLEKKEPHKYQDYLEDLNELLAKCQYLEQKLLKQYSEYISSIMHKKPSPSKSKNEDQKKYFREVAKYLGKKVGFIRHIDKEYRVKAIDLIKELITTEEGKIIRLTDMGTGQSQSAYLKGLLNVADNRKIIALFDEVAMMDSQSLKPIFNRFRKLHNKGILLQGIVVQMADKINVVSKM